MDLLGKRAIVTGGLSGIGKGIVSVLVEKGAVVGVFDIDREGFDRLQQANGRVRCIECDVTDPVRVESAVDEFCTDLGAIDVLVNNAGILFSAPLISITAQGVAKHDIAAWQRVIASDLSSVFYMAASVVKRMVESRTKGVIVNISSISAAGNLGQSAYSAAKAGVNALTKTWAKELGPLGVRVVGVAPGFIDTESTRQALADSVLQGTIKKVPLRRLGRTEEIAHGVASVLQNDFLNGTIVEIDGGLTI